MRGQRVAAWVIASLVLGCAPAPTPTPSVSPPPVPADVLPWPDISWSMADGIAAADPGLGEQAVAVAAGPKGFVAIGYRETEEVLEGLIWSSADGSTWSSAGPTGTFDAVEMLDVTSGPDGFVALGVGTLGAAAERPHPVFFHSEDGRTWERLLDVPDSDSVYPFDLGGDSDGVAAVGSDAAGHPVIWRSSDGTTFDSVIIEDPSIDMLADLHALDEGYAALGSEDRPPVLFRSTDARAWTAVPIDPAAEAVGTRLVVGEWGYIVQGLWDPGCEASEPPCDQHAIGWSSADGRSWTRLPDQDTPIGNGASIVVDAGEHGVIAIDGASAWASPDGWGWQPLPEPGDGSMAVFDAVVSGDVIVAVGAIAAEDGTGRSAIVVAK
jgi:hypothetical protein